MRRWGSQKSRPWRQTPFSRQNRASCSQTSIINLNRPLSSVGWGGNWPNQKKACKVTYIHTLPPQTRHAHPPGRMLSVPYNSCQPERRWWQLDGGRSKDLVAGAGGVVLLLGECQYHLHPALQHQTTTAPCAATLFSFSFTKKCACSLIFLHVYTFQFIANALFLTLTRSLHLRLYRV